jgi:signal transduction histidine kinase
MNQFLKNIYHFVKKNPGILFSLALIILIPLTLYFNTFLAAKSFQKSIDKIVQIKALAIENILAAFLLEKMEDPQHIQEKIALISKENPEIENIRVFKHQDDGSFIILASSNSQEIGFKSNEPALVLALSQEQTMATLKTNKNGQRSWNVIKPLVNLQKEKTGLLSIELSLKEPDEILAKTLLGSYFIMIGAMVLSLILILHHTRLFEYVALSKRLIEIDKMKDDFIRMATHELQSPIANIRGYLEALQEEIKNFLSSEQKEMFWRISISAKNLADLIEDILEVSRIEQGRLDLTPQLLNPKEIITQVIAELQVKAKEKGLILEKEFSNDSYLINVNPRRLHQILFNLINNAIKYTKRGQIKVITEIEKTKKRYLISVKDTGIGMSAEAQKHLFERFYRIKTRETADIPGTGLGLWISKQLTEKMGGQIFVESLEGVGSKFTLVFPLIEKV